MPLSPARSGEMNRRVSIMRQAQTKNAMNEPITAYNEVGKRWAKIEVLFGSKQYETDQQVAKSTYRITMWRDKSLMLTTKDLIYWNDPSTGTTRVFKIEQIPPDPENMRLLLECYEIEGQQ